MNTSGVVTATAAVTSKSLLNVPPGPATVLLANSGTASPVYVGAGTNVSTTNGFPVPTGLVAPVAIAIYAGSPAQTWSVVAASGTATLSYWISDPSGGTGI